MAGDSVIGALRVVLGADTASLESGLKGADKSLQQFAAGAAKAGAAIGAAMVAVGAAIGLGIKHAIDEADKLGKMAQKVGIPVEELSRLKLAADLSGVSMESLGTAMGKLSKNMVSVASGADNEVSKAFKAIGVSAVDASGKIRPTGEVIADIAGKFKGYEDGASKTALAIQLFGKAGAGMIPLLNSGKEGLQEAAREAEQFGIVLDSKTSKSAEAFNDNLTRLSKIKDGIILQVTSRMLPAFENFSKVLVDTAKNSTLMDTTAKVLTVSLQTLVSAGIIVGATFKAIGDIIGAVSSAIALAAQGQFQAAWDALKAGPADVASTITSAAGAIKGIWVTSTTDMATASATNGPLIAAPIVAASAAARGAIEAFLASQQKSIAVQQAEILANDLGVGAKERLRIQLQATAIAQANNIKLTDAMRAKIDAVANSAADMKMKLTALKIEEEVMPPWQKFNKEIERNTEVATAAGWSMEKLGRVNQFTAEKMNNTWAQAGESIAGSFAKIGASFGKENKAMATIAKAAGIVQGTISMFTGAAKALELPFPANLAAMASVLATGAGLVASIRSTQVTGFKGGADFTVPGGIGGGDRVPFNAMLEPGEHVQITPNGGSGRGASSGATITVQGLEPRKLFDGQTVRWLMERFNEEIGDGARLRFA